jgi:hypothetical protein
VQSSRTERYFPMEGAMRRTIPVLAVALAVACGSSGSPGNSTKTNGDGGAPPGADAGGMPPANPDGGSSPPPNVDSGSVPPPSAICMAPIAAADVSSPTTVVGTGTSASCTPALLSAALTKGGVVTFACGSAPATITVTQTIELPTSTDTVVDGGGTVTIDGGGTVRILDWNSSNYRANLHKLTLQHITFAHGHAAGTMAIAPAPLPCSSGYYDGAGAALQMRDGVLNVIDATFLNNEAEKLGPDVGGGAIYLNGALNGVVVGSSFVNNSGSNSGAIGSLNSDLDVYNSTFQGNAALGFGANSNDASKCSVVDKNNQNQVGSGGNAGAIGMDGGSDVTHTFCGDVFTSNTSGTGGRAPWGAQSHGPPTPPCRRPSSIAASSRATRVTAPARPTSTTRRSRSRRRRSRPMSARPERARFRPTERRSTSPT